MKARAERPVILVSACLVGCRVRYDDTIIKTVDERLECWTAAGLVVPFCPETAGGLQVPRPPAEIAGVAGQIAGVAGQIAGVAGQIAGGAGQAVWAGHTQVHTREGTDVTAAFVKGARLALDACRHFKLHSAVLKDGSPSCGTTRIYDGHFRGRQVEGQGVAAALLAAHGIAIYNEGNLARLKVPV